MFARAGARLARAALSSATAPAVTSGSCSQSSLYVSIAPRVAAGSLGSLLGRRAGGAAAARRGCASGSGASAANEAVKEPSALANVIDGLTTAGIVAGLGVMGAVGVAYYAQTTEELEKAVEKGEHVPAALKGTPLEQAADVGFVKLLEFRLWADGQARYFLDPVSDKLLPDHPADASYIPHTLVIDLDDTLILSHWSREWGWRVFKRPGAEDFLKHMAQFYEVVVFSDQNASYVDPIVERLDPQHFLAGRLYREATQYKGSYYLRDLSKLNREAGHVIYITARPKTAMQQENVIEVNPYRIREEGGGAKEGGTGKGSGAGAAHVSAGPDTSLLDLMPFLESIVRLNVKDVREVLDSYKQEAQASGKSIPEIFRGRQVAFQQAQRTRSTSRPRISRGYEFGSGR
jgi:import inner membrane translocase subunit TIM50|uniref:Mitochondrial import inner membrane translocase subunit TIM50 n=1 Tax=Mantoniella antarctica TaxID=81844 RepID=A0A7S0XE65_9CHLO